MRAGRILWGLTAVLMIMGMCTEVGGGEVAPSYSGFPITLNLKDADVVTVLHLIAEETGLNLVVADEVRGKVDVHLVEVPWDQALDEILRASGLIKRRVGNVIHIDTLEGLKRQLELKELLRGDAFKEMEARKKAREMEIQLQREEEGLRPLLTRLFPIRYAKAEELRENLEPLLSRGPKGEPRGSIQVNRYANALLVKDLPEVLNQMEELLRRLDRPTPQILIEARIVQVDTSAIRDLGIQWGGQYRGSESGTTPEGEDIFRNVIGGAATWTPGSTDLFLGAPLLGVAGRAFAVNFPAALAGSGFALGLTLGSLAENLILDLQLSALESENRAHILSRPKVVAMDNAAALIKRGEEVPYIIPRESGAAVEVEFKEANLELWVKPHVIGGRQVSMEINLKNDEVTRRSVRAATSEFPIIARQQAHTWALVDDGQTIVLGGIITHQRQSETAGVPYLKDIPVLNWLFQRKNRRQESRELLIFITPRILQGGGA